MTDFQEALVIAVLTYIGAVTTVLLGVWIAESRSAAAARRTHRNMLRQFHRKFVDSHLARISVQMTVSDWWLNAFEDYGFLRRFRIERIIKEIDGFGDIKATFNEKIEAFSTDDEKLSLMRLRDTQREEISACLVRLIGVA